MSISILNRGASGGLKPELTVTALPGSTIDLLKNGIIVDTYTLETNETEHTFVVEIGAYTAHGTLGMQSGSAEVLIDTVALYEVELEYAKLWLYNRGDTCDAVTGGYGIAVHDLRYTGAIASFNADHLYSADTSTSNYGNKSFVSKKIIDLRKYTKLCAIIDATATSLYQAVCYAKVGVVEHAWTDGATFGDHTIIASEGWTTDSNSPVSVTNYRAELDVSAIDEGAVAFTAYSHSYTSQIITAKCYEIWLE